jgi:hypothetical protein
MQTMATDGVSFTQLQPISVIFTLPEVQQTLLKSTFFRSARHYTIYMLFTLNYEMRSGLRV